MYDVVALDKRMTAFVIPNAIQVTTRNTKYTFTSFLSRDTTFDVIYNVWRLARPDDSASQIVSARESLDQSTESGGAVNGAVNGAAINGKVKANKVTKCACGKQGQHYSEVAMETIFPGTPEKIYNLMFTSGFIKDFMRKFTGSDCPHGTDQDLIPMCLLDIFSECCLVSKRSTLDLLLRRDATRRDVEQVHAMLREDGRKTHGIFGAP